MSDLMFALKMALLAFVMVLFMQVRLGDESIESHVESWIQTSAFTSVLREVAEGGLKASHDAWAKLTNNIKTKYWKKYDAANLPGQRQMQLLNVQRSQVYEDEQKAKKEKAEAQLKARAQKVRDFLGLEEETPDTSPKKHAQADE